MDQLHREQMGSKAEAKTATGPRLPKDFVTPQVADVSWMPPSCVCVCVCVCQERERDRDRDREREGEGEGERHALCLQKLQAAVNSIADRVPACLPACLVSRARQYQFFNMERLDELYAKKRDWWQRYQVCLCLPACLFICLSVCLSVCLPACLPACLSACMPACLPVCLPACLGRSAWEELCRASSEVSTALM